MMKNRISVLLLLLCLCLLWGCAPGEAQESRPSGASASSEAESLPPVPEDTSFPLNGSLYTLEFPETWKGRVQFEAPEEGITRVLVDGAPMCTYGAFPNDSRAGETEARLLAEGFSYLGETWDTLLYWKIEGELPQELVSGDRGFGDLFSTTQWELMAALRLDAEPRTVDGMGQFRTAPRGTHYENHRLGFSLDFPEAWEGRYLLCPRQEDLVLLLMPDPDLLISDWESFLILRKNLPSYWNGKVPEAVTLTELAKAGEDVYYAEVVPKHDRIMVIEELSPLLTDREAQIREAFRLLEPEA